MPTGSLLGFTGPGTLVISGTADRVAEYNTDGELQSSDITTTELSYLDGATSNIQTQLNTLDSRADALEALPDGKIYIGDATGAISEVTPAGDVTITNTGITAIVAGVIVDADVNASAAITRSKLAATSADRVLINNGSGIMSEAAAITANKILTSDASGIPTASTVDDTKVNYLEETTNLASVALNDNQVSAVAAFTYPATDEHAIIHYSIDRGAGNRETGRLLVATDGSTVNMTQDSSTLGTIGVTLSAAINAGNVEIQYTSTSTGTAPNLQHKQQRWA